MSEEQADREERGLTYRQWFDRYEQDIRLHARFERNVDDASVLPGTELEVSFYGVVLVDDKTGVVFDPKTGAPADATVAVGVLGDQVRVESAAVRAARTVIRAEPAPRDFHRTLRDLCKPRRRYEQ